MSSDDNNDDDADNFITLYDGKHCVRNKNEGNRGNMMSSEWFRKQQLIWLKTVSVVELIGFRLHLAIVGTIFLYYLVSCDGEQKLLVNYNFNHVNSLFLCCIIPTANLNTCISIHAIFQGVSCLVFLKSSWCFKSSYWIK